MVEVFRSESLKHGACTYRSGRVAIAAAAADVTTIAADVSKTGLLPDCCTVSLFR